MALISALHASGSPSILTAREQSSVVDAAPLQFAMYCAPKAAVVSPVATEHVCARAQ